MLEAQCSLKSSADGIAQQGDVIVVALPGHPWGTLDRKHLLVVKWEDQDLEDRLTTRRKDGEDWPVISLPYAVRGEVNSRNFRPLLQRSTEAVDIDALSIKKDVLDIDKEVPILEFTDYTIKVETVDEGTGIITSIASAIWSPIKAAWDWLVA